jgi:transcriptional regulator with XRE-family HTH domain
MFRSNVPRGVRVLRRSRGWRQADLAAEAGLSRQMVTRIEVGALRRMPVGALAAVAEALGGSLDLTLRWEGAKLDHLTDAAHAWLSETTAGTLESGGWSVRTEVSFNHFGDRGRVDLLGWHPVARALAIVEVKSTLGDVQETLGRLDVKARLGRSLAREAGWGDPDAVVRVLVVGDSRRDRRTVADHERLFAAFAIRGRQALAWMRRPRPPAPAGLLWFTKVPDAHGVSTTRYRRVRTVKRNG